MKEGKKGGYSFLKLYAFDFESHEIYIQEEIEEKEKVFEARGSVIGHLKYAPHSI